MYSVLYTLQDIFRGDFKNAFSNEDRLSKVYFALADTLLMMLVFGMIKAVLIASVLLIALTAFLPKGNPVIQRSVLSPYVTLVSERMAKIVPEKMKNEFKVKIEELKKAWKKQK